MVWVHLRKDRLLLEKYGKLKPIVGGQFRVVEKIRENAYKLELLDDYEAISWRRLEDKSFFSTLGIDAKAIPNHEKSMWSDKDGKSFEKTLELAFSP